LPNTRGPLPVTVSRPSRPVLPSLAGLADLAGHSDAPKAPAGLRRAGKAVWVDSWQAPWLDPVLDLAGVAELARLEDEIAALRSTLRRDGFTLRVPIVSPRGDVVGEKVEPHPAEAMLRRATTSVVNLRKTLGLTPESRARLGLTHLTAQQLARKIAGPTKKEISDG